MMTQEQDSDLVQWGHRIFDGPYGDPTQHDTDILYGNHFSDNYYVEHRNVENDEMLARTLELEEGLSQLAITEASEFSHAVEEHPVPVIDHDWQIPVVGDNYCEQGYLQEAVDDARSASLCPSPEENSNGEEYSCLLELTDEPSLDGEVSRRLNQMFPVPHVPRINGEIPSTDEATSDYERLLNRLECRGLVELKVQGDGNCQFRALSDQFYRTPEHHKFVRRQVVNQLKSHPEVYEGYVPMAFGDYLKKISKNGEWGDHVTLQAAADSYGVKIVVITSFKDTCYIEILPEVQKSKRVICLSFWAEVHYNSIYPREDFPSDLTSTESKKKKKWWSFGNKN